jgi:transcriptional regulator of acetoin/glycerol metabolism
MAEIAQRNGVRRVPSGYEVPRRIMIPREGKSMEQIEAEAISHTLELTDGNRSAASRILGISRPTLLRKIRKHGLS